MIERVRETDREGGRETERGSERETGRERHTQRYRGIERQGKESGERQMERQRQSKREAEREQRKTGCLHVKSASLAEKGDGKNFHQLLFLLTGTLSCDFICRILRTVYYHYPRA